MNYKEKARELVSRMTLEEKASLCSGKNFWETKAIERLGLPGVMVTDGPHGLRKQAGGADHLGIAESVPSTCFPAACATACSFDRELLNEIGRAIGEECLQEEVAVILGPGVNIKRSPLCGRNFEYFSEDPLIGGELAAALIDGIQHAGVGASLKHYAANNQETRRMTIDTIADTRALREIYLRSFEIPVKKARPWTVMCSYNRIGGVYSSDNKWLLTDVLRGDWGFDGLVMTDWGAMNDRVEAVRAGLDLEMPGGVGSAANDAKIVAAVRDGRLDETDVDALAARAAEMAFRAADNGKKGFRYDAKKHHALARKAAAESCVLLKNEDGLLPLKKNAKLAVIGGFAKKPRYQGTGSSKINPTEIDDAHEELTKLGFEAAYAAGYDGVVSNDELIAEAVAAARDSDAAVVFAGLPDEYESEGFDRTTLEMPESHVRLIREVAKANPNTAVVLQLGAPVLTDWAADVGAVLVSYLGGQATNGGAADALAGIVCPGGKLAESWPLALTDNPSHNYFPGSGKTAEYRESVFVGYRYYETAGVSVAWPFGHGLSYASFEYSGLKTDGADITFTVTNAGGAAGSETAQVYVGLPGSKVFRPKRWLAAFTKLRLGAGESAEIKITLGDDAFRHYDAAANRWRLEGGSYTIGVGSSVKDIRLTGEVEINGDGCEPPEEPAVKSYFNIKGNVFDEKDFAALYGKPLPKRERERGERYSVNDTLGDIKHTLIGSVIVKTAAKQASAAFGLAGEDIARMIDAMLLDMPVRSVGMMAGGAAPPNFAELLVAALNGNIFSRAVNTIRFMLAMIKTKPA